MTKATTVIMYASVRWREIGMKALMIAAINYLEVKSADIHYMHTQVAVTEKVWTILGLEFSKNASKTAVIVRALSTL